MNVQSLKSLVAMVERGTMLSAEGERELVAGVKGLLAELDADRARLDAIGQALGEAPGNPDSVDLVVLAGMMRRKLDEATTRIRELELETHGNIDGVPGGGMLGGVAGGEG